jgi:hypothetical protein
MVVPKEVRRDTGTALEGATNKKARHGPQGRLSLCERSWMVGSDRLELSTYGLRVGIQIYLPALIAADRINTNQQLMQKMTVIANS